MFIKFAVFIDNEQVKMIEQDDMEKKHVVIAEALDNLQSATGLKPMIRKCLNVNDTLYDSEIGIGEVLFTAKVIGSATTANVLSILAALKNIKNTTQYPLLLIGKYFSPSTLSTFQKEGVNVLDSSGNCQISSGQLFINIQGRRSPETEDVLGKSFNEAGLRLILYFLLDQANVSKTYRAIHNDAEVSLGTIKNTIESLMKRKFITIHDGKRMLINRDDFIELWQQSYNAVMKPKLFMGKMRFISNEAKRDWTSIILPDGMSWGGESGANLIDGYLMPENLTIYSDVPIRQLLTTRKVMPSRRGDISVYRKCWKGNDLHNLAPKLIIYADLMGSGDSRCLEAAQRLKDNGI